MSVVPEGPIPEEIVDTLRKKFEDAIATPKLISIVTIDDNGYMNIYSTWPESSLLNLSVATAFMRRTGEGE